MAGDPTKVVISSCLNSREPVRRTLDSGRPLFPLNFAVKLFFLFLKIKVVLSIRVIQNRSLLPGHQI